MEGSTTTMGSRNSVRELRRRKGRTQEQLAEATGLSLRTIQRLESRGTASMHTLRHVADALGVSLDAVQRHSGTDDHDEGDIQLLVRLTTGQEVLAVVGGAQALEFDNPPPQDPDEVSTIARFLQLLQDYGDLWDGLEAGQRVEAQFEVDTELRELEQRGLWVFGGRTFRTITNPFDRTSGVSLLTAVVRVVRRDDPSIIAIGGGGAAAPGAAEADPIPRDSHPA